MDENNIDAELVKERETTTGSPCLLCCWHCLAGLAEVPGVWEKPSEFQGLCPCRVWLKVSIHWPGQTSLNTTRRTSLLICGILSFFSTLVAKFFPPQCSEWCVVANISAVLRPDLNSLFLSDGDLVGSDGPAVQMAQILCLNFIYFFLGLIPLKEELPISYARLRVPGCFSYSKGELQCDWLCSSLAQVEILRCAHIFVSN